MALPTRNQIVTALAAPSELASGRPGPPSAPLLGDEQTSRTALAGSSWMRLSGTMTFASGSHSLSGERQQEIPGDLVGKRRRQLLELRANRGIGTNLADPVANIIQ